MSHRPLAFVSGLTVGDYLLWNWSLNSSHDALALVSGLTLPPLAVATVWLLALSVMRLLAHHTRTSARRSIARAQSETGAGRTAPGATAPLEETQSPAASGGRSSGKLAA